MSCLLRCWSDTARLPGHGSDFKPDRLKLIAKITDEKRVIWLIAAVMQ